MRRTLALASIFALLTGSAQAVVGVPHGWLLAGDRPQSYTTGVEDGGVAYLASSVANTGGFGTLMQSISAQNYIGKRVRFRAAVRSQEVSAWAGLWMRVDKGTRAVAFDNMQQRPIRGTSNWQVYEVVLDIPEDATSLSFGTLLSGSGEVWLRDLALEIVNHDVATTTIAHGTPEQPLTPTNLDFMP